MVRASQPVVIFGDTHDDSRPIAPILETIHPSQIAQEDLDFITLGGKVVCNFCSCGNEVVGKEQWVEPCRIYWCEGLI